MNTMLRTGLTRLPVELFEAIVDNLDGHLDVSTLRACSTTCKTSLFLSYRRLYYCVKLRTQRQTKLFIRIIQDEQCLVNPADCVRYFSLTDDLPRPSLNVALCIFAERLSAVTALHIANTEWRYLHIETRSALITGFQAVRELDLTSVKLGAVTQMLEFFRSFPSLTRLAYTAPWGLWITEPSPMLLPSLTALDIRSDHAEAFATLLSAGRPPNLRAIQVDFLNLEHAWAIGTLLEMMGSHLECLTFCGSIARLWELASCDRPVLLEGHSHLIVYSSTRPDWLSLS